MTEASQHAAPASWRSAYELPVPGSPMVGRARELEAALTLLAGGARLLTVTGERGVGKTRFAIEIAACIRHDREAAFLRLSPLRDPAALPAMLASVCSIDGWPDLPIARLPPALDAIVVLDGFDHMRDAGPSVVALLERCPTVVVIVTSRDALQIPGETIISLEPLAIDTGDAFALSIQIAGAGSDLDPSQARKLALLTAGNPGSLSLIAGQLRAGRDDVVEERAGGPWRPAALVTQCIDALPEGERRLLRRLSVMAAGFGADAAGMLAMVSPAIGDDAAGMIESLVRHGLVVQGGTAGGFDRYEIPASVREVALTQLNDLGELPQVRLASAQFMLDRVSVLRDLLFGRQRDTAMLWFEVEQTALRLAFGTFIQLGRSYEIRKLALALWPWWILRRRYREGRRWLKLALERADSAASDDFEQELLVASGLLELYSGHRAAARTRAAAGAMPGLGGAQHSWRGASLGTLGMLAAIENDWERALGLYRIFLESTESSAAISAWLPHLRAVIRLASSAAYFARDEIDEAEYHATVVLKDALRLGDPMLVGYARIQLAAVAARKDNAREALETYRDGLSLLLDRPHAGAVATGLLGLAQLATKMGCYAVAFNCLDLARLLLDTGAPPPPHLVRFDTDALEAAIPSKFARNRRNESMVVLGRWNALEPVVEHALADLMEQFDRTTAISPHTRFTLTGRELEVLCLVVEDMSNRDIADALFINERTVETHVSNVLGKLGSKSRVGAVSRALRDGLCA